MDRQGAIDLLERLHEAQNDFYSRGDREPLEELLDPEITWVVPGRSPIAGTYRGLDEVFDYFQRRRELAAGTFRMIRRDVLTGDGDHVAALTDGVAVVGESEKSWSTVGLYEVAGNRISACRLIPFDQAGFDEIWSGASA